MTGLPGSGTYPLSLAEQRLCAKLPAIIGLGMGETLTVGHAWNTVSVSAIRDKAPSIPFAQPWMPLASDDRGRRRIEGAIDDALELLARQRAWRIARTDGPPVTLLRTNTLWDALVATGRFDPQDLVDRVHRQIRDPHGELADAKAPIGWWRNERTAPGMVARRSDLRAAHLVPRSEAEPWMAGRLLGDGVVITAYSPNNGLAVMVAGRPRFEGRTLATYEIRTTARLPETVVTGSVGRPVAAVVREDVIDRLGGTIVAAAQTTRTLNLRVRMEDAPSQFAVQNHQDEFDWQQLVLSGRRAAIIDAIGRAFRR